MKAILFKVPKNPETSFKIQIDRGDYFYDRLHYHPEFQISIIKKGKGIFYGGNDTILFEEKDVFLIGANTPHLLKNSDQYYTSDSPKVRGVTIFFGYDSFGKGLFDIPEMEKIKELLTSSSRIIKVTGEQKSHLYKKINKIKFKNNQDLIIELLKILSVFQAADKIYVCSKVNCYSYEEKGQRRLNEVLDFTFNNLSIEINLDKVAEIANLSKSQFSRYFKLRTGKTYMQFLNEVRIEHACTLLLDEKNTIEKICYDVGFQNLSNFNRQFKKAKKTTPSAYRSLRTGNQKI